MHKMTSRMALAVAAWATCLDVQAQGSITLYGNVDLGVAYISNVGGNSLTKMLDGMFIPTLWGLRGEEDIGNGRKAVFKLENGFLAASGQQINPGSFFNRQAYVGLADSSIGSLTLGRQSSLAFDMISPLHSAGWTIGTAFAYHPGNFDDLYNSYQVVSSLKYRVRPVSGLDLGLLYGGLVGEPGNPSKTRTYQAAASYSFGPFAASAMYGSQNDRPLGIAAATGETSLLGVNLRTNPFVADNVKNFAFGLRYAPGSTVYAALFTQTRITYRGRTENMNNFDLAGHWQVFASDILGLGYTQTRFLGGVRNTVGLTWTHAFSKRTTLYGNALYQHASDGHVAAISLAGVASGQSQSVFMAGLRHAF